MPGIAGAARRGKVFAQRTCSSVHEFSLPRPAHMSQDKRCKILGRGRAVDLRPFFSFEFDLRAMQRLAIQHELPKQVP